MSLFNHKLFLDELWKHSMRMNIRELAIATGLPTGKARKIRQGQPPDLESFLVLCKWMELSPRLFMIDAPKVDETPNCVRCAGLREAMSPLLALVEESA